MLIIVGTPLGNLKDIGARAIDAFSSCDAIFCEDTRRTLALLNNFSISKKVFRYNDHIPKTLNCAMDMLKRSMKICLVTDAGMPCISDPGWKLVRSAIDEKIDVQVIPGPSAAICALSASGFPCDNFTFLGFLPRSRGKLFKKLKNALLTGYPVSFYESPFRLKSFFEEAKKELPSCQFVVARELTKTFEQWLRGNANEILSLLGEKEIKGEITIVAWENKYELEDDGKIKKVLYVCSGNICRSVMAHKYSEKIFPTNLSVSSAGLFANEENQIPQEVLKVLSKEGIERFQYKPVQLSSKEVEENDLILCMTSRQTDIMKGFFPQYQDKIFQISEFAGLGKADIVDPWGKNEDFYALTFKTIKNFVKGVLERILIKNI